ncbi:SUKH-3 domain-containing protein [Micromonospora sp. 4G57]|uniref:SUKH-3 domain-containing protein n=1 Tax=Micromonospora sicca TaxID=2202420 RepID=A0ABU5JE64_9ACTN|nr:MULTISPECIES: SUKH-3 domain-containing protein [unclassified Micromonospora]MDZ5445235.1 SUKH-3 domain-containing protein [Micromonospora sp. 4G57]MDZ5490888.1 SUKH-3 domain-containing protein [Micromonospora sp. 4G53]
MIERQQAEQLAAVWAQRDSERLGFPCTPVVEEFDLGYLITSRIAVEARALPGDLPTTVVDKETGDVSTWPRLPFPAVEQMYRQRRPPEPRAPRTMDPASQLLREITRLPTPGAAAHLTLDGRVHRAFGAKGEVELRHHPLVRTYLDELPPGQLVRGGERHAEMIVVSDVLHEYDHRRATDGLPPLTMQEAETLLGRAGIEFFRVREAGDPAGGRAELPCDSCVNFLVRFNALPWSDLAYTQVRLSDPQVDPDPGRFPPQVTNALVIAGWRPHFGDEVLAAAAVREVTAVSARRHSHQVFPAVMPTITAFPGLATGRKGPGEQVWISRFEIDPRRMAHTADTLADFGAVLGVRLFPLGTERGDSIIAVDEHGRIFALDQAGEWFLGPDIDAALTTLLLGRPPARVRDDGTW